MNENLNIKKERKTDWGPSLSLLELWNMIERHVIQKTWCDSFSSLDTQAIHNIHYDMYNMLWISWVQRMSFRCHVLVHQCTVNEMIISLLVPVHELRLKLSLTYTDLGTIGTYKQILRGTYKHILDRFSYCRLFLIKTLLIIRWCGKFSTTSSRKGFKNTLVESKKWKLTESVDIFWESMGNFTDNLCNIPAAVNFISVLNF